MVKSSLIAVAVLTLVAGCSQSLMMQGRKHLEQESYQSAIDSFYEEIRRNPDNAVAWRELGYAYYGRGDLKKAEDALMQSNHIRQDALTHTYLGLVHEKQADYPRAIDAYTVALSLQPRGKIASLTRGHLDRLLAKRMEGEVARALENEKNIDTDTIPDNTIAVSDFDGSLLSPELAPIALGLAELTAIDLSKARALTVVERRKLDFILRELELGVSGYIDPATAPRMGRLMGAHKLVTGSVVGIGEQGLKVDGVIVAVEDTTTARPEGVEGDLPSFFRMQKSFVFAILQELGIQLSVVERDAISEVPTESYLAFLAYSRGLDFRRRGMYDAAKREFNEAVEQDPDFQQAAEQFVAVSNLAAGGTYEQSLAGYQQSLREQQQQQERPSGVDGYLSGIAQTSGAIPGTTDSPPPNVPPVVGKVRVKIRGDLDAQ